jgi:hypothetical protein
MQDIHVVWSHWTAVVDSGTKRLVPSHLALSSSGHTTITTMNSSIVEGAQQLAREPSIHLLIEYLIRA